MRRDVLEQRLQELDELTNFSIDLTGVDFLCNFPFRNIKGIFTQSCHREDLEGVLLAGVSMLRVYDQVRDGDDPAKDALLDLLDKHFSFALIWLDMFLDEFRGVV